MEGRGRERRDGREGRDGKWRYRFAHFLVASAAYASVTVVNKNKHTKKVADDKHRCFICFGHEIYYMMPLLNYHQCHCHYIYI